MKEHPILFSASMVQAILDGRKAQTRRIINPQPRHVICLAGEWVNVQPIEPGAVHPVIKCPYGKPGDRLWVRETFRTQYGDDVCVYGYRADYDPYQKGRVHGCSKWKPSIHMPRLASRITLKITNIRAERLQDISEEDAKSEGITVIPGHKWRTFQEENEGKDWKPFTHRDGFMGLWNNLNEERGFGWESNPWVWAVSFKRIYS